MTFLQMVFNLYTKGASWVLFRVFLVWSLVFTALLVFKSRDKTIVSLSALHK